MRRSLSLSLTCLSLTLGLLFLSTHSGLARTSYDLDTFIPGVGWKRVRDLLPDYFISDADVSVVIADPEDKDFLISIYRAPDDYLSGIYRFTFQRSVKAVNGLLGAFSSETFAQAEASGLVNYYIFDRNGDGKIQLDKNEFPCIYDYRVAAVTCAIGNVLLTIGAPKNDPRASFLEVQKLLFASPTDIIKTL